MQGLNFNIYAVDFDGTLCNSKWPELGPAREEIIEYLINRKKNGHKIILWTCRTGKMLEDAVNFCRDHGLYFDAVNQNIPEVTALYGGDSRKVCADYYIDDKAATPSFIEQMNHFEKKLLYGFGKEDPDGIL